MIKIFHCFNINFSHPLSSISAKRDQWGIIFFALLSGLFLCQPENLQAQTMRNRLLLGTVGRNNLTKEQIQQLKNSPAPAQSANSMQPNFGRQNFSQYQNNQVNGMVPTQSQQLASSPRRVFGRVQLSEAEIAALSSKKSPSKNNRSIQNHSVQNGQNYTLRSEPLPIRSPLPNPPQLDSEKSYLASPSSDSEQRNAKNLGDTPLTSKSAQNSYQGTTENDPFESSSIEQKYGHSNLALPEGLETLNNNYLSDDMPWEESLPKSPSALQMERSTNSPSAFKEERVTYANGTSVPQSGNQEDTRHIQNVSFAKQETLEDAWQIALDSSRTLSAKDDEHASAESNIRAARGVGLPKISNASGRHTVSDELSVNTDVELSKISPMLPDFTLETPVSDKDFTTSITTLTVPIYMGGKVRGMIEAANAAAGAVASGKEISRQDLKYEVAQTYFLVLRVRKLLEVAQEAEKTIAHHEQDAQRLFETGIVTRNVVLAAQVAHANAEQDVIKAENAVRLSEAAYNRLLWRPLDTSVSLAEIPIPEHSEDLNQLTSAATSGRSELSALAYKSQALNAEAKVHRADRLPQVAAIGSHNYVENSHLNTESTFSGSIGVVWMPFDGGVSRNRQEASQFEAMSAVKEHEDARSKIELQVYQCWLDEKETRGRIGVAEKAVEESDENLRIVSRAFNEGLANHTEVLDAQTLRTQAWSNLANAHYDAILASFRLHRAVGNL